MRGRPLDVTDEGVPLDGETTALFISRLNLLSDAIQEMKSDNVFNLRFPLDINFHAENAEDLGGPRKEFFNLILREIREHLLTETDGHITLKENDAAVAHRKYFYAGIFIGKLFLYRFHTSIKICHQYLFWNLNCWDNFSFKTWRDFPDSVTL